MEMCLNSTMMRVNKRKKKKRRRVKKRGQLREMKKKVRLNSLSA